jgi:hypothetical protein
VVELDHLFILCDVGAPEAARLTDAGFVEGSANVHPGQGTASRRFFFETSYLELLWVDNPEEAQSEPARITGLWERWSERRMRASPFGIVLRPGNDAGEAADPPPFASVPYRPNYLPAGVSIGIAADVALAEPAFFWLPFQRGRARLGQESTTHRLGRRITAVHVGSRPDPPRSQAALIAARASVLTCERAGEHRLDLTLDGARTNRIADLRPDLPLRFLW